MTVATMWAEFRAQSLPENAPAHQVRAMEMAFMAGLSAAVHEATRIPDGAKSPTLAVVKHNIGAMSAELQAWAMEAKFR